METKGLFNKIFVLLLLGLVLYFVNRDSPPMYMAVWLFWVWVVGSAFMLEQAVTWNSRYGMPKFVSDGISGSMYNDASPKLVDYTFRMKDGTIKTVKYAVFNLGECTEPIHLKGKLATAIVPFDSLTYLSTGKHWITATKTKRFPMRNLPLSVSTFLSRNQEHYNTKEVYFGVYSQPFIDKNPELPDFEAQLEALENKNLFLTRHLEGKNNDINEIVETAREVSGSKKGWLEGLSEKIKKDKDEE